MMHLQADGAADPASLETALAAADEKAARRPSIGDRNPAGGSAYYRA
jgi:hypothetical protein